MKNIIAFAMLAVAACGGAEGPNPMFAGRWVGTTTVTPQGQAAFQYLGSVDIAVSETTLAVLAFCPDSTGRITVFGSGDAFPWSGDVGCASPTASCPATSIHYLNATAQLISSNALNITGSGVIRGCGPEILFTSVFRGSK